ncbi:MAG: universal stress protein [Longimicrobiales bacterium]
MKALIGVDFSPASTAAGDWVSRWFLPETPLAVAYSVEVPRGPTFTRAHDGGHELIAERAKAEAEKALAPLVQEFGPERTEAIVGRGAPSEALMEVARDWGADVVAIGPHGHSPFLSGSFGSTASYVVRAGSVPVLVVRAANSRPPKRVLVAIDDHGITAEVLSWAKRIFDMHDCDVIGFYDFDMLLEGLPVFSGPSGDVDLEVGLVDTANAWLKESLVDAGIPTARVSTAVAQGRAGSEICAAAADNVDLIVMGTHGAALAGPSVGSVARYVIGHAPCPVFVVPAGPSA